MDYKKLGTSDLLVSPVCVGCVSCGERFADFHEWTLNQDETMAVVKHALDLGINFFDTANCYAHGTFARLREQSTRRFHEDAGRLRQRQN